MTFTPLFTLRIETNPCSASHFRNVAFSIDSLRSLGRKVVLHCPLTHLRISKRFWLESRPKLLPATFEVCHSASDRMAGIRPTTIHSQAHQVSAIWSCTCVTLGTDHAAVSTTLSPPIADVSAERDLATVRVNRNVC
jgi:hypothetical protein